MKSAWAHKPAAPLRCFRLFEHRRGIIQIVCGGFQSFLGDCLRIVTGVCVGTQGGSKSTISWQRGVRERLQRSRTSSKNVERSTQKSSKEPIDYTPNR